MSNGHGTESPRTKIATSRANLGLAIRLNSEVIAGRIQPTIYQREVLIVTGGPGLFLPKDFNATAKDLKNGAFNLVIMALGASALTVDETLDEVFGKSAADLEPDRQGLRVLVNQMRNAFAHNLWRPRWQVWAKDQAVHLVNLGPDAQFKFDARALDGKCVKPEDVGGLETWVNILKHCENIVPSDG